jgi:predicted protein tyrosine phosphatase
VTARSEFVPFGITVCGVAELDAHCEVGVSHVLSILDPGTEDPAAFGSYGEHERLDLRFNDIIDEFPGMLAPRREHVERLLAFGRDLLAMPRSSAHLLVHCYMGISRSTAAMSLILAQARPDRPAVEALDEVRRIRPHAWPNLRLVELGDELLGRRGELVAAAHDHYRRVVARRPEMGREMVQYGRAREVPDSIPGGRLR